MSDWPELERAKQKKIEEAKAAAARRAEQEREAQRIREARETSFIRWESFLTEWDPVVHRYLSRIAGETWPNRDEKWSLSFGIQDTKGSRHSGIIEFRNREYVWDIKVTPRVFQWVAATHEKFEGGGTYSRESFTLEIYVDENVKPFMLRINGQEVELRGGELTEIGLRKALVSAYEQGPNEDKWSVGTYQVEDNT